MGYNSVYQCRPKPRRCNPQEQLQTQLKHATNQSIFRIDAGITNSFDNGYRSENIQTRHQANTIYHYYFLLMLAQQQQNNQDPSPRSRHPSSQPTGNPMDTQWTFSKCFYNCTCYCCSNGCCIVTDNFRCSCWYDCCCCDCYRNCCCYLKCYQNSELKINAQPIHKDEKLFLNCIFMIGQLTIFRVLWFLQIMQKWIYNGLYCTWDTARFHHHNRTTGSAAGTNVTSSDQGKQKPQYGQSSYDRIANDQQLKTNNLCKFFCNNRKRQRRRRRKRRRRRRPCSGNTNKSKQVLHQQPDNSPIEITCEDHLHPILFIKKRKQREFSLQAFKTIINQASLLSRILHKILAPHTDTLKASLNPTQMQGKSQSNLRLIVSPRVKRARANFLLLLIGLFWFESPKLINGSAIASQHIQQFAPRDYSSFILRAADFEAAKSDYSFNAIRSSNPLMASNQNVKVPKHCNNATSQNCKNFSETNIEIRQYVTESSNSVRKKTSQQISSNEPSKTTNTAYMEITDPMRDGCSLCQLTGFSFYGHSDHVHTENHNRHSHKNYNIELNDHFRLESIKKQILSKLGLTQKPNVSHPLPKQFIWDTIYRADESIDLNDAFNSGRAHNRGFQRNNPKVFTQQYHLHVSALSFPGDRIVEKGPTSTQNLTVLRNSTQHKYKHFYSRHSDKYYIPNEDTIINYRKDTQPKQNIQKKDVSYQAQQISQPQPHIVSVKSQRLAKLGITHILANSKSKKHSPYLLDTNRYSNNKKINNKNTNIGKSGQLHKDYNDFNDYSVLGNDETNLQRRDGYHHLTHTFSEYDNRYEREDFFGSTQEIITFAEKGSMYNQHRLIEFSTKKDRTHDQTWYIRSAKIHIRIDKQSQKQRIDDHILQSSRRNKRTNRIKISRDKIKIWIFQLITINNNTNNVTEHVTRFCASFVVEGQNLGWQKFDMTEVVREWYGQGHVNKLRLLIDCSGCSNRFRLHLFESAINSTTREQEISNPNRPFLVMHTETNRLRRVRRRAVDCGGALNGQCCKESFYVSFKALGWDDWIIAPRGYFANYCRGDCTGPYRTPDTFQTFHAHFIEEYRKMGLLNGMKPCCAPVKFSSMSLIYYGDDGIIKRDLPKMVVDECGCP